MATYPPILTTQDRRALRTLMQQAGAIRPALRRGFSGFAAGRRSWPGEVQTAGPNAEADYTNHRYWVKLHRLSNTSATLTDAATTAAVDDDDPGFFWTTVTNFAEKALGTHLLQSGDIIEVFVDFDLGHTVDGAVQREPRYWTDTTPAIRPTLKITGHSSISGHPYQWLYSGIEQTEAWTSGLPVSANKTGASEWTNLVYNQCEIGNPTSAGVILSSGGIDISSTGIPATVSVLPLPNGLVVPFEPVFRDGAMRYRVCFPNAVIASC